MLRVEYFADMVSAARARSVVFGVITWYIQNRENKMINQARLFMQIYERFNDEDFYSKYNDIVSREKWKEYEQERTTIGLIAAFYEGIGILVEQKLIDIELVSRLMSTNILLFWEKVEPIIKEFRRRTDNPHAWEYAEWLHNNIKNRRLERKPMYMTKTLALSSPFLYSILILRALSMF